MKKQAKQKAVNGESVGAAPVTANAIDISKPAPGCKRCYVLTGTPADGAFLRTVVFGWEPVAGITEKDTTLSTHDNIANLPILESA